MSLSAINKVKALKREKKRRNNKKGNNLKAKKLHQYKSQPIEFLQDKLGIKFLTEEQKQICLSIRDNQTTNVQAAHGVGKCVAEDEKIILSNGSEVQAKTLVGKDFELLTIDNGKVVKSSAIADWNAVEDVYEIITESGRRIIRNDYHPLWTAIKWSKNGGHPIIDIQGWSSVFHLKKWMTSPPTYQESKFSRNGWKITDDRASTVLCAVPYEIPVFGDQSLPEHEIKIMAYLIGDGGLTQLYPVFTQEDNKQLAEFRECIEKMGCILKKGNKFCYRVVKPEEKRYAPKISTSPNKRIIRDFSCDRHISTVKFLSQINLKPFAFYNRLKLINIKPTEFNGRSYLSSSQVELYWLFDKCLKQTIDPRIKGRNQGSYEEALKIYFQQCNNIAEIPVDIELLKEQKHKSDKAKKRRTNLPSRVIPNNVTQMLKNYKLMGKHSRDKLIPNEIFQLPKKQLAIFLSRLFSTDGWACVSKPQSKRKHGRSEIGFCSISRELVEQIQRLLLRFGITSNISEKTKVNAWILQIHNSEMQLRFAYEIGIYGKEEAIDLVVERAIIAQGTKQKMSWRHKNAPEGLIWEKIKSIKKLDKPQQTIAIEVPGHHHYLTHFWEHNSFLMAGIITWWIFAVGGAAVSTAPTFNQVNDILWKEVRRLYDKNKKKLGGRRNELSIRTINHEGKEVVALGKTSKNYDSNSFQGLHDEYLLLIEDEADGITNTIDEAFESCLTGSKNRGVRVGNPLSATSAFAKNCSISHLKIPVWNHINVSWAYYETIAVNGKTIHRLKPEIADRILKPKSDRKDDPVKPQDEWDEDLPRDVIPGAVSIAWIEKVRAKYGEFSSYWMSRVEAEFPGDDVEGIIPFSWLKEARDRYNSDPEYWDNLARQDKWRIGVDVSDGGDRHAIAVWRGKVLYSVKFIQPQDDREDTVRLAKDAVEPLIKSLGGMYGCAVDNTGVGAGTLGILRRDGYFAVGCKFGESAKDKNQFANRKIELYWQFREWLRYGEVAIAPLGDVEDEVFEEIAAVRYNQDTENKTICEPKKETIKRIKRSPDGGDAVIIAGEIAPMEVVKAKSKTSTTKSFNNKEERKIAELLAQAQEWHQNISEDEANKFL